MVPADAILRKSRRLADASSAWFADRSVTSRSAKDA
jgi:hypothetical protein